MVECGNGMLGGGGVEVKVWILTLLSSTEREKEKYLIQVKEMCCHLGFRGTRFTWMILPFFSQKEQRNVPRK